MAFQHQNIPSQGCHEPKHFSNSSPDDAGKVLTPDFNTPGRSVLRRLDVGDIIGYQPRIEAAIQVISTGSGSLNLQSSSGSAVNVLSLFSSDFSQSISNADEVFTPAFDGTYNLTISCKVTGSAGDAGCSIYYAINDGTPNFVDDMPMDGELRTSYLIVADAGDTVSVLARSNDDSSKTFTPRGRVQMFRVCGG